MVLVTYHNDKPEIASRLLFFVGSSMLGDPENINVLRLASSTIFFFPPTFGPPCLLSPQKVFRIILEFFILSDILVFSEI